MDVKQEIYDYNDESYHNILIQCPSNYSDTKYYETFNGTSDLIKQEDFKYDPDGYLDIKQEELVIKNENANQEYIAEDSYKTCNQLTDPQLDLVTPTPERKCTECDFRTNSRYRLHTHRKQNHREILPYKCTKCDFTSRNKVSITQHLMTHLGEKPYKCESCDFRTSKQYLLNRHLKFHTEKNLYHCDSCDFKTNQKSTLLQHIRSHTGERPFNCSLCEYTGRTAHQMKIHMMQKHSGNSPYLCNVCGLKISDKTKLTVHMRTHSGEKPYECDLCGYKLTQKSSLVRHKKVHTMMKTNSRKRPEGTRENFYWPNAVNSFNMGMNCFNTGGKPFKMGMIPFNPAIGAFNQVNPLVPYEGNGAANMLAMNMQLWRNSFYDINISKFLEDNTMEVKEEAKVV